MEEIDVIVDIEVNKFVDSIKRELKRDINNFLADKKVTDNDELLSNIKWQILSHYESTIEWLKYAKEGEFKAEQLLAEGKLQTIKFFDDLLLENLQDYESVYGTTKEV